MGKNWSDGVLERWSNGLKNWSDACPCLPVDTAPMAVIYELIKL